MSTMKSIHAALLRLCLPGAVALAAVSSGASDTRDADLRAAAYAEAVLAFRSQRYPAAYGLFMRLADAGDLPSAQVALVMYDHGATLFGREWYASPDQQRRWNALVVNAARGRGLRSAPGASD
jgi:hypothetical protein